LLFVRTVIDRPPLEDAASHAGALRLGVVGCGTLFERYYLPALAQCPAWSLVAAGDTSAARRRWVQRVCPELVVCERLPAAEHGAPLDALFIATPPDSHCRLTIAALEAGLHVLVEKPMALNTTEARRMLDASRRAGRRLWVGFTRRFRTAYRALQQRLATTRAGDIAALTCHFRFAPWDAASGYLGDEARGGGVLHDVASHQMDLLPWLLGQPIAAVRAAAGGTSNHVAYDLRFANGLVAHCAAAHGRRYREHIEVALPARRLITGTSAVIESRRMPSSCLRLYARGLSVRDRFARTLYHAPDATRDRFVAQFRAVAAALRGDDRFPQPADAQQGFASMRALEACAHGVASPGTWIPVHQ
jgi:predicted dehydrogenase